MFRALSFFWQSIMPKGIILPAVVQNRGMCVENVSEMCLLAFLALVKEDT